MKRKSNVVSTFVFSLSFLFVDLFCGSGNFLWDRKAGYLSGHVYIRRIATDN